MLLIMHDDVPVTKDERCKPDSLILYDQKRGVDVVYGYVSPNNLQSQFMDKMQRVLKVSELRYIEKALDNLKECRCHVCKSNIVGKPDYIALRDKLIHRLKKRCVKCLYFVLKRHSEVLCSTCTEAEVESVSSTES